MCAIGGRVNRDPGKRVLPAVLSQMAALMAHRGPDGEGFHLDGAAGLCHRRLAIVDRKAGGQPMANEDGTVWISFNGEIYNHAALRGELCAAGHRFATCSDTEVIVHGYEVWGAQVLRRLTGMFAFAIWDARTRTLLLARDRVGIKPLYYALVGQDLVFASEVKAILCHPDVLVDPDPAARSAFLAHRYVPGPRTAFRGIEKLQPGHRLTYREGKVAVERWWDLSAAAGGARDPRATREELTALFVDAVTKRLMGEVPVGVFLSGGIDSTSVAWAMSRAQQGAALKSYSVGFPGEGEGGELSYARLAARALGTDHHEILLTPQAFESFLPRLVWHLDEPVADAACVPLYHLAEEAKREVTVVLSGEGADEVLAGYPIYWRMLALDRLHRLLGPRGHAALRVIAGRVPDPKIARYLRWAAEPLAARYRGVSTALDPSLRAALLGGEGADPDTEASWNALFAANRARSPLSRLLDADLRIWLPDDLLVKADKMTMASAVELRVPFLDHRIVEFTAGLPDDQKLRGRTGKWLLREAMRGLVPAPILTRPKRGFPVPTSPWLKGPLHRFARDRLLSRDCAFAGLDPRDARGRGLLSRLLDEHRMGRHDRGEVLWALLIYDLWHERFVRDQRWRKEWPTPSDSLRRQNLLLPASAAATSSASRTTGMATPSPRPT